MIKLFKKIFLKPTGKDKTPTDPILDDKIALVKFQLQYLESDIVYILKRKIKRFFKYRWKFLTLRLILISTIIVLLYLAITKVVEPVFIETYTTTDTIVSYPKDSTMTIENFLLQIQYTESRYNPSAYREGSQFWGLYQIGELERKAAGYGDISKSVFENHPEIQHMCMINLMKYNKSHMQKYIDKYDGKIIDGVLVTESGIIALCQLGCGAAQKYLDKGIFPQTDANGNSPRSLIKLGGYNLDLDNFSYKNLNSKKLDGHELKLK